MGSNMNIFFFFFLLKRLGVLFPKKVSSNLPFIIYLTKTIPCDKEKKIYESTLIKRFSLNVSTTSHSDPLEADITN